MTSYLLDANTLIEAKNRYYQLSICPGFWDWLLRNMESGLIASVESVEAELRRGNDSLAGWAREHTKMFLPESDQSTQTAFAEVAQHLAPLAPQMKVAGALEEFLGGADPWLIAKARVLGATIVTHERLNMANRKKFLIPNVCKHFEVPFMDTFERLNLLGAQFVLLK
jgi:hypothetical protein